jgi:hypothetical protein
MGRGRRCRSGPLQQALGGHGTGPTLRLLGERILADPVVGWVDSAVAVRGVNLELSAGLVALLMPGGRVLSGLCPEV